MNDLYIALISGGMALLGVVLSSTVSYVLEKYRQKTENLRYVRDKKEETYRLISEYILIETQNKEMRFVRMYKNISTEHLVKNIEISLKLYVTTKIRRLFYSAYEAVQAELPTQILDERLNELEREMRKDIGLVD